MDGTASSWSWRWAQRVAAWGEELVRSRVLEPWPCGALCEDARKQFEGLIGALQQGNGGRPWCAYAVESLKRRRFLVADARSRFTTGGLASTIKSVAALFERSVPFKGVEASRADSLTVLIDVDCVLIDETVHEKRGWLLRRGLMMAALHPESDLGPLGQTSDGSARPFRSEGTFLSVRWAVPADRTFTRKDKYLDALLEAWLSRWETCRQ